MVGYVIKRFSVLVLLYLSACCGPESELYMKGRKGNVVLRENLFIKPLGNILYYPEQFNEAYRVTISRYVAAFPERSYEEVDAVFKGRYPELQYVVELHEEAINCDPLGDGTCNGTFNDGVIAIKFNDCIGLTSFSHEILHAILYELTGDLDPDHTDPRVWDRIGRKVIGGEDSAEFKSEQEMIDIVCPCGG